MCGVPTPCKSEVATARHSLTPGAGPASPASAGFSLGTPHHSEPCYGASVSTWK